MASTFPGEYYHVYNRGIEKRDIFLSREDISRFIRSISLFNSKRPIGSLFEMQFKNRLGDAITKSEKLVDTMAYAANPNHFHLLLTPLVEDGVGEFTRRLGIGYTRYFNEKYERSGVLFQGRTKVAKVSDDSRLLELSFYINLNAKVHRLPKNSLCHSSWDEYVTGKQKICATDFFLTHFDSPTDYKNQAEEYLPELLRRKKEEKDYQKIMID